jgi:hypothetical protein
VVRRRDRVLDRHPHFPYLDRVEAIELLVSSALLQGLARIGQRYLCWFHIEGLLVMTSVIA